MAQPKRVALTVIPRPTTGSRSHFVPAPGAVPVLKGTLVDAPTYCCGSCGAILIEGVRAEQFIDASQPFHSDRERTLHPAVIRPGEHAIKRTIAILDETLTTITDNGPLVLTCPLLSIGE